MSVKSPGTVANATSGTVTSVGFTSTGNTVTITGTNPVTGAGTTNLEVTTPSAVGANPTATAGPSAVNGSATTFMRSDGAPAVGQQNASANTTIFGGAGLVTFAGSVQVNNTIVSSSSSGFPGYRWNDGAAGTNLKNWQLYVPNNTTMTFVTLTDANALGSVFFEADRGATTAISAVKIGNATDNPTFSVLGTGGSTFSGNVAVGNAGSGVLVKEGSNAKQGITTLVGGTAVVSNTSVTANSRIFITAQSLGTVAVPSAYGVSARSAGTSFTILASAPTDTSVVAWEIFEPAP